MQKNAALDIKMSEKDSAISNYKKEIKELKSYISKLEEVAPAAKVKKITGIKLESATIESNLNTAKVQSGGTF